VVELSRIFVPRFLCQLLATVLTVQDPVFVPGGIVCCILYGFARSPRAPVTGSRLVVLLASRFRSGLAVLWINLRVYEIIQPIADCAATH
jgi:hypothetical protein